MLIRHRALAALTALLSLGLVACGSSEQPSATGTAGEAREATATRAEAEQRLLLDKGWNAMGAFDPTDGVTPFYSSSSPFNTAVPANPFAPVTTTTRTSGPDSCAVARLRRSNSALP